MGERKIGMGVVEGLKKGIVEESESRKKWDYFTEKREVSEVPSHIDIEPTNACNLSCIMCERKKMRRKVGFMDIELYKNIIDQCLRFKISSIKLNLWGESLIHKQIVDMIMIAKRSGIERVQFNTNGLLLDEEIAEAVCKSGLDRLTFSIDGVNEATYEYIRKNSEYVKVIKNLEYLLKYKEVNGYAKPIITVQIIRMKETEKEISDFVSKWKELADYVTVTNIATISGMEEIKELTLDSHESVEEKPCPQLWQRLSIHWNGDVTVCCSDFDGFLRVGNIKEKDIKQLWNSDEFNHLREKHIRRDFNGLICQTCDGRFDER